MAVFNGVDQPYFAILKDSDGHKTSVELQHEIFRQRGGRRLRLLFKNQIGIDSYMVLML